MTKRKTTSLLVGGIIAAATAAGAAARAGETADIAAVPCCKNDEMGDCPRETHAYGTSTQWYDDLELATKRAVEEGKLLYVLQIAGNLRASDKT